MSDVGVDLSNYEAVNEAAPAILQRLRGNGRPVMPPRPHRPWATAQIDLFGPFAERHPV